MDYKEWLSLLGLPANDRYVASALRAYGIESTVTLEPQELSTGLDFKDAGLSLGFTSEFSLRGGEARLPILSSVVMMLRLGKSASGWTVYGGSLPHGLSNTSSKEEVVALLGAPTNLDDDFCSAQWVIDGKELGILFTDDWRQIKQLGLSLPRAT